MLQISVDDNSVFQEIETFLHSRIVSASPVTGGDINNAYRLKTSEGSYFLKTNDAGCYPEMLAKEAAALRSIRQNLSGSFAATEKSPVPKILANAVTDSRQYLLLEWIEQGYPNSTYWQDFGALIAVMHLREQSLFGWPEDNYIGSLAQPNSLTTSWPDFYSNYRLLPLGKKLLDAGSFSNTDVDNLQRLCSQLPSLFPTEKPSLLHGDLWSGNFLVSPAGSVMLIDPAVYFGHREMDIGMSLLFGGFDKRFYEAYEQHYPLSKGWRSRIPLTQLYPIMVHAVLFGGHYISSAKNIINRY